jgi:hypothetical protein
MPNKEHPKIKAWTNHLKKVVGKPDEETYFIGHSIGCQTIIRYLEKLPKKSKVGGVIFVAGFFALMGLEDEEKPIAKPWIETPINTQKARKHTKKMIALFSTNDPYVPLSNKNLFKKRLNARIIIEKNKGHYSERTTKKIPVVLKEMLKISK